MANCEGGMMTVAQIENKIAQQQRIQASHRYGTIEWREAHANLSRLVSLLTGKPHDKSKCVDCIDEVPRDYQSQWREGK